MAVRPVVITGEPVLHHPAKLVEAFDTALADLVADMVETNAAAHGVGLAAPQVGVALRVFVYDMANDDEVPPQGVVVNPILTVGKISTDRPDPDEESEGCLSVPGESFPLKRADHVRVQGFDAEGEPLDFEATGWFARCMQHEFDHLNGKLYVDRLDGRGPRRLARPSGPTAGARPATAGCPASTPTRSATTRSTTGEDEGHDATGHDERVV